MSVAEVTVAIPDTVEELLAEIDGDAVIIARMIGHGWFKKKRTKDVTAPIRPRPRPGMVSTALLLFDCLETSGVWLEVSADVPCIGVYDLVGPINSNTGKAIIAMKGETVLIRYTLTVEP